MSSRAGSGRRAVRMEDAMDWKRTGNRRGMELKTVPVCGNKIRCEAGEREEVLDFPMLQFPALSGTGMVRHCFTTRLGGVSQGIFSTLNLSFIRGDDPEAVTENYRRVAQALDVDFGRIVCSDQTHTTNVRTVTEADAGKGLTRR